MISPYITFRDKDSDGQLAYYILQRKWPYYVGKITDNYSPYYIAIGIIPGYKLWVVYDGVLEGRFVPSNADMKEELKEVFQKMADWYYSNRILANTKKFKHWAL